MSIFQGTLASGLRTIPEAITASGEVFSTAIVSMLDYNQHVISHALLPRQLISDYYERDSYGEGALHTRAVTTSGCMIAQYGPFPYQHGMHINGVSEYRLGADTDDVTVWFTSTPVMKQPTIHLPEFETVIATASGYNQGKHIWKTTVDEWEYITPSGLTFDPNPGNGNMFYIQTWAKSEGISDVDLAMLTLDMWEEPNDV